MRASWIIAALSAAGVAAGAAALVIGPIGGQGPPPAEAGVIELSWDDLIPAQARTATQLAMDALRAEAQARMAAAGVAPPSGDDAPEQTAAAQTAAAQTATAQTATARTAAPQSAVSPLTGQPIAPAEPIDVSADERGLRGIIPHSAASSMTFAPEDGLVRDFDGKRVRLPGYIVPLDFDGERTSKFLLVPFVGACVHVPPPPANQIVYVETDEPYRIAQLFEAVYAEGVMSANVETTELAEVGYRIDALRIRPYQ